MGFKIVHATPEHARDIAQIHVSSWRTTYQGIVSDETLAQLDIDARAQQWRTRLMAPEPSTCIFVAVNETGQLVGFATGGPIRSQELNADAELYAIYLYQEFQRKGIGRALFCEVARWLEHKGFSSLAVWVLELNPSRRFYEVLGGEIVTEKPIAIDDVVLKESGFCWPSIRTLLQTLSSHSL
jgi:GNAT superfamily N-acetyltransferase